MAPKHGPPVGGCMSQELPMKGSGNPANRAQIERRSCDPESTGFAPSAGSLAVIDEPTQEADLLGSCSNHLEPSRITHGSRRRFRARNWSIGTDWASGLFHVEGDGKESLAR